MNGCALRLAAAAALAANELNSSRIPLYRAPL